VFWLAVYADADCEFYSAFWSSFKQREQAVSRRMFLVVGVFVEVLDLFFVDSDRQHFFLLVLVGMGFIALDNHEAMVFVEFDFAGGEEYFGEEVLFFEYFLIIRFFEDLVAVLMHILKI
jgi:hypothetical protein